MSDFSVCCVGLWSHAVHGYCGECGVWWVRGSLFSPRVSHARLLPQETEVPLVCDEAEHDQVGV